MDLVEVRFTDTDQSSDLVNNTLVLDLLELRAWDDPVLSVTYVFQVNRTTSPLELTYDVVYNDGGGGSETASLWAYDWDEDGEWEELVTPINSSWTDPNPIVVLLERFASDINGTVWVSFRDNDRTSSDNWTDEGVLSVDYLSLEPFEGAVADAFLAEVSIYNATPANVSATHFDETDPPSANDTMTFDEEARLVEASPDEAGEETFNGTPTRGAATGGEPGRTGPLG